MAKSFELSFHTTIYMVPKPSLFSLFEHRPELMRTTRYQVQSSVPFEIFQLFVKALKAGTAVVLTKENVSPVSLLAEEFFLEDLQRECAVFQKAMSPESIYLLS
jgi:hypothetical protein